MGKHLELTPRLRQIAAWVRQGAHLADVGTDHAYLPVWLTLQGRVASAIASDLRRAPWTGRRRPAGATVWGTGSPSAWATVWPPWRRRSATPSSSRRHGGREHRPDSGRGTLDRRRPPHPAAPAPEPGGGARRFLAEHGYAIAREALVRDRGFLYPVIEAGAGEMHLTLGRQWAGADLLYDPLGTATSSRRSSSSRRRRPGPTGRRRQRPGNGAITPGPSSRSFCK